MAKNYDPAPEPVTADEVADVIASEHHRLAREQIQDSPEGHARSFTLAILERFHVTRRDHHTPTCGCKP